MLGVTFGSKHSYNDWGIWLEDTHINPPLPKRYIVDVPARNGLLDLTPELTPTIRFENRTLTFNFRVKAGDWSTLVSQIYGDVHGKTLDVVSDLDPNWHWHGCVTVDDFSSDERTGVLVITVDADPFKLSNTESSYTVNGNGTITCVVDRMEISPAFELTAPTTVIYGDSSYVLESTATTEKTLSGDIVSFADGTANPAVDLTVDIEAVQDGEPWVDSDKDKTPYLFRAMSNVDVPRIGNRETDKLIGGSIAWNQLIPIPSSSITTTANGVTLTDNRDGSYTLSGTATELTMFKIVPEKTWTANHKYVLRGCQSDTTGCSLAMRGEGGDTTDRGNGAIWNPGTKTWKGIVIYVASGSTFNNVKFVPTITDITSAFGTEIADYIYSLEQANAGAGVAFFKKYFPNGYYPYNTGEMLHVQTSEFKTVGFNQWDEEWETGNIDNYGVPIAYGNSIRSKNFNKILPNTTYYTTCGKTDGGSQNVYYLAVFLYDADKNFIVRRYTNNATFTTPENARYFKLATNTSTVIYGNTYNHDICINIHWDGTRDGEYEPYTEHSYPLDDSLTLRGIPKLDADNNLYYDGDTYEHDGTVTRKYGIVDLGTLTWDKYQNTFYANLAGAKIAPSTAQTGNAICSKYIVASQYMVLENLADKAIALNSGQPRVNAYDSAYANSTATEFKTAVSGVYLVYELATQTTESADPFTNPQVVDSYGTEEYVTTGIVPVGHESSYSLTVPISGWDEVNVNVSGVNIWDEEWEVGYISVRNGNNSPSSVNIRSKNYIPVLPNKSYYLKSSVGTVYCPIIFYDANKNFVSCVAQTLWNRVITVPSNASYMRFYVHDSYGITYKDDISINYPSTDHDYHAYNGQTYTIDLDGTRYGGTLNVTTGVLTITHEYVDLGTLTWVYITANQVFSVNLPSMLRPSTLLCSNYAQSLVAQVESMPDKTIWNRNYAFTPKNVVIKDSAYNSAAAFKTAMDGVQLVYELATPQVVQLTAEQVMILKNQNNIWADSGEVEVTYLAQDYAGKKFYIPDLELTEGSNTLTIQGTGTTKVTYTNGRL